MKTKNRRTYPRFRFMAMSKMIGIIAFGFVFMITVYSMKEMHNTGNYDALPQLIISAFGFASIYAGFYLTMAKAEQIEEEISLKRQEINDLFNKINELMSESQHNLL